MSAATRRRLAGLLIVLATITGFLALASTWVKRQALDSDRWVEVSGELIADDEIREALAGYLTDQIFASGAARDQIASALPPQLAPLAGPASGALQEATRNAIDELLQRPKIVDLWQEANRTANQALINLIDGEPLAQGTSLDLSEVRTAIAEQLGIEPGTVQSQIQILAEDELGPVQDAGKLLKPLSIITLLLTLALYGGAIALTEDRRRTLINCGISLVVLGAAIVALRSVAGNKIVDALASTDSIRPPALRTWLIGTSLLGHMAVASLIYGFATIAAGLLAGPSRAATRIRGWLVPLFREPAATAGVFATLVLLLIAWGPTPALGEPLGALIIAVLLGLGVFFLRRRTLAEAATHS